MTDRGATRTQLSDAVLAAADALASTLRLGDETRPGTTWSVGDGDAVIAVSLTGEVTGTLLLAVSNEVAARLPAATDVLTDAITTAVNAVGRVCGLSLAADVVDTGSGEVPEAVAEILDAGRLSALAGLILPAVPDRYEPESFRSTGSPAGVPAHASMSLLHDVEMVVTAELGRTTMPVRELLGLTPGMVVEIDRAAGAPIDLLVNGKLIAAGEVVVIDEEFGIRITEIAPAGERT